LRILLIAGALTLAACGTRRAAPVESVPWFADIARESGIDFTHVTGATGQFYMPEIMGAGCALLDYDGDGDLDVLLIQGGPLEKPGEGGGARLYRNELLPSGKLRFTEVTQQAGLSGGGYGMGAATGDLDGDGRIDLLITRFGGNTLYRNNADGTFRDVTAQSPAIALRGRWSSSASFFDYDGDGRQDLIVLEYMDYTLAGNKRCLATGGEQTYCTPNVYRPAASHLFHNEGGRFVEVTAVAGIDRAMGRGLGVAAMDVNGDGAQDLFVANDALPNSLWLNNRDGTFAERALDFGVAYSEDGLAKAGMGVAPGDYDNDGREDLLVLNLMREGGTLFSSSGPTGFTDVSRRTGIHKITFPFTGFGTGWFDADNDGWLDLFVANGAVTLREEQRGQPYPFYERNQFLRNPGASGGSFTEASDRAGAVFQERAIGRGAAFGDVDLDGLVDILVTNNHGPARLLRNGMPKQNWFGVRFDEAGLGIGVVVEVKARGVPTQRRRLHTDSSYLSASEPAVRFGLGQATSIESVTVHRPGMPVQTLPASETPVNKVTIIHSRPPKR
jgi:hypothetical protein